MTDVLVLKTWRDAKLIAKTQEARLCFAMDFTDYVRTKDGDYVVTRQIDAAKEIIEQYKKQGLEVEEK